MKRLAQTAASVTIIATATISYLPNRAEAITFNSGGNAIETSAIKQGSLSKLMFDLAPMAVNGGKYSGQNASFSLQTYNNNVVIDAVAASDVNSLLSDLQGLGLQNASIFGSFVSGMLPIDALASVAQLESLKFAKPTYKPITNVGKTTSQANVALRADIAREQFGVDGTGVTIGVLSDSFNFSGTAAEDVANGDLPSGIQVLKDLPNDGSLGDIFGIDEGRAMMQLIHDVAPGADLAFHTAAFNETDFAQGILALADAGADIIVDDIFYPTEPMFQDGVIAQAIDTVVAQGVSYFSAAGNDARQSYESAFNGSNLFEELVGGEFHDFDSGAGVDIFQSLTIPENSGFGISFQWDSPFFSVSGGAGSLNDLDIFLFDQSGTNILASSVNQNVGNDAVEFFSFFNDGSLGTDTFNLAISKVEGLDPGLMKYILFGEGTLNEYDTASGTVFGHPNARGAEAVGAAFYQDTPEFGVDPALLEPFSSAGPTPILFDRAGNRLANPEIRLKPEIIAADGTNTTFFPPAFLDPRDPEGDGFPNFFGTSAAAPHAAAVAALMLDAAPDMSPSEIYRILETTALDMESPGFDFDSGFGLIQADRAVAATVPEPGSVLGLLVFGTVGIGVRLLGKKPD
ncbi:peptidase families S8 and S53 domain protein [Coleofasciculus chthonoplastes PCC 7420]|uniref:Peptidase families S8 and S53 domain protein n=1 Tax=Coleofasciculus chthonoplastes PCC 7420 TaxID=118168 RepID=B4VVJ7_9CYAN|nr:S8 family serine peptidase [Coleofasciculus chthonoplastes]EDX73882.1 peptidase families S8 and S53 domain protein [Coleofasciculus chthonoplastes PCC 7420]